MTVWSLRGHGESGQPWLREMSPITGLNGVRDAVLLTATVDLPVPCVFSATAKIATLCINIDNQEYCRDYQPSWHNRGYYKKPQEHYCKKTAPTA